MLPMWLRRWLRMRGYDVEFVHNITDVDDKILEAPGPSAEVAAEAADWYLQDIGDFELGMPDALPRATRSIPQIIGFIERLVATDHAYAIAGDVYFRVSRDAEYGRLSGQRPDQVAEQEPNPLKEDSRDFALWKGTKPGEDISFESPWGHGRPGWHIECSVMAEDAFGPVFEIHGGGLDLVFPHHENELAQSRALGHEFARIWMHNGMLRFTGEKMSKSAGNVETIREALGRWQREALLLFFMTGHWRKPLDYSDETLMQAQAQWLGFQGAYRTPKSEPPLDEWDRLVSVLEDDFNTPDALALLHEWRTRGYWYLLDQGLGIFGLRLPEMAGTGMQEEHWRQEREAARAEKDWARADELRNRINRAGFDVIDEPSGSRLVRRS
jgi:cysteinyl-tRNA synthetase